MSTNHSLIQARGFPFHLQRFQNDVFDLTHNEEIKVGHYLTDNVWVDGGSKTKVRKFPVIEILESRPARGNYSPLETPTWYRVKVGTPTVV